MIVVTRNYSVHNSSVCLTENGRMRFFIEEERLDRIKHYRHSQTKGAGAFKIAKGRRNRFEKGHVYCCESADIDPEFYFPLQIIPLNEIFSHHLAHAAASFYASEFESSYIITLDGFGDEMEDGRCNFQTGGWYFADKDGIKKIRGLYFPQSMGLFYASFTDFVNLGVFAEGKLMGLAPYGDKRFDEKILSMIDLKEDGSFELDLDYFKTTPENSLQYYLNDLTLRTSVKFERVFGERRKDQDFINGHFEHLAHSAQNALEKVVVNMLKAIPSDDYNLCMGGGIFLNCPVNSLLRRQPQVKDIFIFPAADDSGLSFGYNMLLYNELKILSEEEYYDLLQLLYFDHAGKFYGEYKENATVFETVVDKIRNIGLKRYFLKAFDTFLEKDSGNTSSALLSGDIEAIKIEAKDTGDSFLSGLVRESDLIDSLSVCINERKWIEIEKMLGDENTYQIAEKYGYLPNIYTEFFKTKYRYMQEKAFEYIKKNLDKLRIYQIREITAVIANRNMQDIISELELELIEKRKDTDLILFLLFIYKMLDKKHNFLSLWRKDFRFIDDVFLYMIRAAWEQKQYDHILEDPEALDRVKDPDLLWILCQIYYEMGDTKCSEKFLNRIPEPNFDQQVMKEILEAVNSEK